MEQKLQDLWSEARELHLGTTPYIDRLTTPPTPLAFLRDYISPSKPCIISPSSATTLRWPALSLWSSPSYLLRSLSSHPVSLHLTPDGRADALTPHPTAPNLHSFASPCVTSLPFPDALHLISATPSNPPVVAYAQQQNDSFRAEYSPLAADVDSHIPFASAALGSLPEAVNLWIGNQLSQTSFHKDHYENLYAVVTGEKHFLLLPPTDVHRLYVRPYPAARYVQGDEGELRLELEEPEREVPWCSVDPYPRTEEEMERQRALFPLYFEGPRPFECTVKAGEILYLPSMWFHHVRQTPDSNGRTIAINYWYDMQFDIKYAYFNFLQSIEYPSGRGISPVGCEHHFDDSQSQIDITDLRDTLESETTEQHTHT